MSLTHLVQQEDRKGFYWSDTNQSARIKRKIGEPVILDLSRVHPNWRQDPIGFAKLSAPHEVVPRGREVSFYVVEKELEGDKPYIKVQYVEARR